jgi:hypothetical protein
MMLIFDYTPHTEKQTDKPAVASHATNTMPRANYKYVGFQNDPTFHEHAIQGLHVALGILAHLFTPIIKNYLPIKTNSPYG